MKIVAMIQCRMNSRRMPGKILREIMGKPVLSLILERVQRTRKIDEVAVLTTTESADDVLVEWAKGEKVLFFRGSEADVLDRYYQASRLFSPDAVVRLTGDNPFYDWKLADTLIAEFLKGHYDYFSNGLEPTFPIGVGAEVFTQKALEKTWAEAKTPYEREHVTPYIYRHPERFRIGGYKRPMNASHYRLTMDTPEDYALAREIYENLYPVKPDFGLADILDFLQTRPKMGILNRR